MHRRTTAQEILTDFPDGLDVVASRRDGTVYLHVVNTQRTRAVAASIQIGRNPPRNGRVFEITADPAEELSYLNSADQMKTVEKPFAAGGVWEAIEEFQERTPVAGPVRPLIAPPQRSHSRAA